MFFWSPSFIDSYYSVNPVWQNILKKNTDFLKHISRTSLGNIFVVYFRDKLDFVHTFTLPMLLKSWSTRPEIVEIVGDSYDPKRSPLKGVAFNSTFFNAGTSFFNILTSSRVTKCNILSHSTLTESDGGEGPFLLFVFQFLPQANHSMVIGGGVFFAL